MDTTVELQSMLERLLAGDPRAKELLITRAYDRLLTLTRQLLGSFGRVRAEEETAGVLNDAYLRLHAALDEVKPTSVRQFIGLAALELRRVLLDRVRKMQGRGRAARPKQVGFESPDAAGGGAAEPGVDGDESRLGTVLDLLSAVETLPDDEREVVDLKYFQGLTEAEAGKVLGVHEDTVKRRWAKARIRLAGKLDAFTPGA